MEFDGCRIYLVTPAERKKFLEGVKQVRTFDTLVASLPPSDPLRQRVNDILRMTAELDSADRVDGAEIMAWGNRMSRGLGRVAASDSLIDFRASVQDSDHLYTESAVGVSSFCSSTQHKR